MLIDGIYIYIYIYIYITLFLHYYLNTTGMTHFKITVTKVLIVENLTVAILAEHSGGLMTIDRNDIKEEQNRL